MNNIFSDKLIGNDGVNSKPLHVETNSGLVCEPSVPDRFVFDDIDDIKVFARYILQATTEWGELKITPAAGVYAPNLHLYIDNKCLVLCGLFLNTNSGSAKQNVAQFELPYAPKPAKTMSWQFNYYDEKGTMLDSSFTVFPDHIEDNQTATSGDRYGYVNLVIPLITKPWATSHVGLFDSPPPEK